MRVSDQQRYKQVDKTVSEARLNNSKALERVSTLKKVNRLSDNPIGASKIVKMRDRTGSIRQYVENIEFAKGYLEKTETAVTGITDNLIRARELAVGMANSTNDASSRMAASKEMGQIVDEVVSLANANFADRYVFSGFRTATPAIAQNGQFMGDDGAIFIQVDGNDFRQINIQSRYLFEPDPGNEKEKFGLLDSLMILQQGLEDNDPDTIRKAMSELETQLQKTTSYQASLGALFKALDQGGQKLEAEEVHLQDQVAKIEQVDIFKASSESQRSEAILQSSLMASNKLMQPSLLNFLQ